MHCRWPQFWASVLIAWGVGGFAGRVAADGESQSEVERADARYDPVSPEGQRARGLYYSGVRVRYLGAQRMVRELKRAHMNAAVIDLKDGEGQVTYPTAIPELQPQVQPYLTDPKALVSELKAAGVYTIARIVCFTDPSLPVRDPSRAVIDGRSGHEGEPWAHWAGRNTWLDPFNPRNHALVVALAQEAEAMGFDEVQFDYFRFPVDPATEFAVFPADTGEPRHVVLARLLAQVDAAIHIPLGVDVFGITAFPFYEPQGLGQILEAFVPHVEVLTPMLYVNGMTGWMRDGRDRRAERLVRAGVGHMRKELGEALVIRPFLQGFAAGADHYDAEFIAEQVRGVAVGGGDGYLFWHPNSDYDVVAEGMRGPVRRMFPFPDQKRFAARRAALAAVPLPTAGEVSSTPEKKADKADSAELLAGALTLGAPLKPSVP